MKRIKTFGLFEADYHNSKGGKFWGDEGAGILPICNTTGRILVAMRSDAVNEPNTWGIFGGKIDHNEEPPIEAARRELMEESGYVGKLDIHPAFVWVSPDKTFKYSNFIGVVDHEFDPEYDWETAYAEWMTLQEFLSAEPKHFGLKALISNSLDLIKKFAK